MTGMEGGQLDSEKFLLETKVTLMFVLRDQVELKVIEQCQRTTILNGFVRYVVKKLDFSQIQILMAFFPL